MNETTTTNTYRVGNPTRFIWRELVEEYHRTRTEFITVRDRRREIAAGSADPERNEFWKMAQAREVDLCNDLDAIEAEILDRVRHISPYRWHLDAAEAVSR